MFYLNEKVLVEKVKTVQDRMWLVIKARDYSSRGMHPPPSEMHATERTQLTLTAATNLYQFPRLHKVFSPFSF